VKWLLPTLSEILLQEQETGWGAYLVEPSTVSGPSLSQRQLKAEREWWGAIAALEELLVHSDGDGLLLCGPLPIFSHPEILPSLSTWVFIPELLTGLMGHPLQLLPAADSAPSSTSPDPTAVIPTPLLPLLPDDPLGLEQFCLVLTPSFSLVLVLGTDGQDQPYFQFSFNPEVVHRSWQVLEARAQFSNGPQIASLKSQSQHLPPVAPDYRLVSYFSRALLTHLSLAEPWTIDHSDPPNNTPFSTPSSIASISSPNAANAVKTHSPQASPSINGSAVNRSAVNRPAVNRSALPESLTDVSQAEDIAPKVHLQGDLQLLQALTHEVSTPLATIRTLTRLLLRRGDLAPEVITRLEGIDQECTQQIDRFGLIFKAVEMETKGQSHPRHLATTSLQHLLETSIPRWQKQANRRRLVLNVALPQQMPTIVSDPTMLDQALTGLIERFTRHLPAGSHITMEVVLAGDQLKLQLQSQINVPPRDGQPTQSPSSHPTKGSDRIPASTQSGSPVSNQTPNQTPNQKPSQNLNQKPQGCKPEFSARFQSLGQLLLFQPETGSLSLNLDVTKNLFQALGGKLKIRERSQQGEVLTIFLPLEAK
jgi:hypothetical protein